MSEQISTFLHKRPSGILQASTASGSLFNKMPANPGYVNEINFLTIGLLCDLPYTDAIRFRQFFLKDSCSEFFDIADFYTEHEVLGKFRFIISLENEPTVVTLKTDITVHFPIDIKAQILEKLFSWFKIAPRRNKWLD